MKMAVIIPALNEAGSIETMLTPLQAMRQRGHELILVDGGSRDQTCERAADLVDKVIHSERGRALQMNRGAESVDADILLFLHADTIVDPDYDQLIIRRVENGARWGRFNVRFTSGSWHFRMISFFMNLRSCLTSIATGDQAIFVRTDSFWQVGGFPHQALMEDIEISVRLRRLQRAVCLSEKVITSSRRWEQKGVIRTILLMWSLRLAYFLGVPADRLAGLYR